MQAADTTQDVHDALRRHWGFDALRPLQAEAIGAETAGRDSVVVIPTGGGKSLCYQLPAATRAEAVTLVISPLIALMKDQVDALTARGVPAAFLNSSLDAQRRRQVVDGVAERRYRLLYVAPERLPDPSFIELARSAGVRSVAIDEAHCISHWGHDFRPEYRRLSQLRDWFPEASIHAFTATATPRVREDIVEQLRLGDPAVVVGDFDRPNLTYRVHWRRSFRQKLLDIISNVDGAAGIVYCIRRRDVDQLAAFLQSENCAALPYHAGLSADVRKANQESFVSGRANVIVATIAFGMGIDRPDIRYVVHAAMPKSIEAYQQESGRAGRDGQPADCHLFYTTGDFMTWKSIIEKSEPQSLDVHVAQLREILGYCQSPYCRRRLLVEHFGQEYPNEGCEACDSCLNERPTVPDGTTVAMKILSAVVRTGERFGARYVSDVLTGAQTETVRNRGHDRLSVFGLLSDSHPREICAWIDQLAAEGYLNVGVEYRTFSLTPMGRQLMRGDHEVELIARPELARARPLRPASAAPLPSRSARSARDAASPAALPSDSDDDVDAELYEALRSVRNRLAAERHVPAYCVVSNKTLVHIARAKPSDEAALLAVPGMGRKKLAQYGDALLACVNGSHDA